MLSDLTQKERTYMTKETKTRREWIPAAVIVLLTVLAAAILGSLGAPREETVPAETAQQRETLPPNRYGPGDFSYDENGFLTCSAGETVLGIDVSHHQQEIDWAQVSAAGVEFVMVRLGNRGYVTGDLAVDRRVTENLEGARAAGLKVGAYFYSQAISAEEAREEAELALEILNGFPLDLPLAYDWEQETRTAEVDARTLTDCTLEFCRAVEAAGYEAMIYFNSYQAVELLYLEELTHYPWWLAMYDTAQKFPYRMDMWQYTRTGSVPGIAGNVDVNLLFTEGALA